MPILAMPTKWKEKQMKWTMLFMSPSVKQWSGWVGHGIKSRKSHGLSYWEEEGEKGDLAQKMAEKEICESMKLLVTTFLFHLICGTIIGFQAFTLSLRLLSKVL